MKQFLQQLSSELAFCYSRYKRVLNMTVENHHLKGFMQTFALLW